MAKKDEARYEVKTVEVRKKCPECGKGYLISTDKIKFGEPLKFEHKCDKCGHKEYLACTYPYTKYEYREIK